MSRAVFAYIFALAMVASSAELQFVPNKATIDAKLTGLLTASVDGHLAEYTITPYGYSETELRRFYTTFQLGATPPVRKSGKAMILGSRKSPRRAGYLAPIDQFFYHNRSAAALTPATAASVPASNATIRTRAIAALRHAFPQRAINFVPVAPITDSVQGLTQGSERIAAKGFAFRRTLGDGMVTDNTAYAQVVLTADGNELISLLFVSPQFTERPGPAIALSAQVMGDLAVGAELLTWPGTSTPIQRATVKDVVKSYRRLAPKLELREGTVAVAHASFLLSCSDPNDDGNQQHYELYVHVPMLRRE